MIEPILRKCSALLRKSWTQEQIDKYVGSFWCCYFSYASDPKIRRNAASGGSITALLASLLENGRIDGALVCRARVTESGQVRPAFFIARTLEELRQSQGSKYVASDFAYQAIPLIQKFDGRLAVVGLPCDIGILQRLCARKPEYRRKVALTIALFCGHNSEPELTDALLDSLRPGDRYLVALRYRLGHWRGTLQADFAEGHRITRPFSYFSDYQNLYFFCQRKCHHCHDHTGYFSDVSAGDIWSLRMKAEPIKHTALITRSEAGDAAVNEAAATGWLRMREEPIAEVCEGQARTMPFHYNITARSRMAWLVGESIPDPVSEKVRLTEYLTAAMALCNEKISRGEGGKKFIFSTPRVLLKLYLYLFKALESL